MTEDVNVQEKKMKNFSGFDLFCFYLLLLFKSSGFKDEELCEKGGKLGKIGKYTNINERKIQTRRDKINGRFRHLYARLSLWTFSSINQNTNPNGVCGVCVGA